jgi:hypothetical protein
MRRGLEQQCAQLEVAKTEILEDGLGVSKRTQRFDEVSALELLLAVLEEHHRLQRVSGAGYLGVCCIALEQSPDVERVDRFVMGDSESRPGHLGHRHQLLRVAVASTLDGFVEHLLGSCGEAQPVISDAEETGRGDPSQISFVTVERQVFDKSHRPLEGPSCRFEIAGGEGCRAALELGIPFRDAGTARVRLIPVGPLSGFWL